MRWKKALITSIIVLFWISVTSPAFADETPYTNYNYSYFGDAVHSPAAYLPETVMTGKDLGVGNLNAPSDMYVTPDKHVYILDSGNNRILVLNSDLKLIKTIAAFNHNGKQDKFKNPQGIFVSENHIYVADTGNNRVVILDNNGQFSQQIDHPKSNVLPKNFKFIPQKVGVDMAGRVYVISQGEFNGIMEFNQGGNFDGFFGTINVSVNPFAFYWKKYWSTKAQKAQMQLFLPTTFSNLDVDDQGFIYATNFDKGTTPIKRLNPGGSDVLKRNGYSNPQGDLVFNAEGENAGPSQIGDIKYDGYGMYTALDTLRGRLFTYDNNGNLLYIFGGLGSEVGDFKAPVAVEKFGDDFMVLDQGYNTITLFKPTVFGQAINQASIDQYLGKFTTASNEWRKVISLDGNYQIAYIGIGQTLLNSNNNHEAMTYFKLGDDRTDYSVAFKRYRRDVMRHYFGVVMSTIIFILLLFSLFNVYRKINEKRRESANAANLH